MTMKKTVTKEHWRPGLRRVAAPGMVVAFFAGCTPKTTLRKTPRMRKRQRPPTPKRLPRLSLSILPLQSSPKILKFR
jgi:hypothetical protein